jgi:molybdopterin-guanine dinucleotide biosynthesis protein A
MDSSTAFILAGGQSSRMGRDKAFLELGGKTLLQHAIALARTAAHDVVIVGDAVKLHVFGQVVEDVFPGCGPLGGIHAALLASRTQLNLMLAVDLPFLQPTFLRYLISEARQSQALVTLPRLGSAWEPLCAVYRKGFAATAERALQDGRYRIDALYAEVKPRIIDEGELTSMGFSAAMFRNLNTPQEFEKARKPQL